MTSGKLPRYIAIALDIAKRINDGELAKGEKISGRTMLAAEYNVSPETIRKAVKLLHDMDIVEILPKSGIYIKSSEHVSSFMGTYKDKGSISEVKRELKNLLKQKSEIESKIQKDIEYLIENTTRVKKISELNFNKIIVPHDSVIIGKSLRDLAFWQMTGATVAGVSRNGDIHISLGPDFVIEEEDVLLYVGAEETMEKVDKFVKIEEVEQ
jgi:K+/H+ antiporter YhaU regulatory subunit KhtT